MRSYAYYIGTLLKEKNRSTEVMDKFLRSCGSDSYYCVREFYCKLKSEEEVWSDIYTSFIEVVNRYEYKDRHFAAYVHNVLGYELGRTIHRSLRDMRDHKGLTANFFDTDANLSNYRDTIENNLDTIIGYEEEVELTDKWIEENQKKEDSLFHMLNQKERRIVKMYYDDNFPDTLIANKLYMHINTVNKARKGAIKKIEEEYNLKHERKRKYIYKDMRRKEIC